MIRPRRSRVALVGGEVSAQVVGELVEGPAAFEREHQAAIPDAVELDLRLGAGGIALPAPCPAVIGHLEVVPAAVPVTTWICRRARPYAPFLTRDIAQAGL